MAGTTQTFSKPMRLVAAVGVVVVLLAAIWRLWGDSSPQTEDYWDRVHALTKEADAIKDLETVEEAVVVLRGVEERLGQLSTDEVDPLAAEAASRFRDALVAARRCAEHVRWMEEHPIRTAASVVIGEDKLQGLRSRILEVRQKTLLAYDFAVTTHHRLSDQYPRSCFTAPLRPDVVQIDDALAELDSVTEHMGFVYEVSFILGALARLLVGV